MPGNKKKLGALNASRGELQQPLQERHFSATHLRTQGKQFVVCWPLFIFLTLSKAELSMTHSTRTNMRL